jgi:hypothetical protein
MTYRITSPLSPRLTRTTRTLAWAEEWAQRLARLTHEPSEIERRDKTGAWQAVGTRREAR